jgi:hypothetical protein
LLLVLLVYALAGLFLLRTLVRRRRGQPYHEDRRLRRLVYVLASIGLVLMAYARFVEPYWPEVRQVRITSPLLERGTSLRIVHISDLHSDPTPRLEPRIPDLIAAQHPDIVVFTGDLMNSRAGLPVAKATLRKIAAHAPVYTVEGNWDAVTWFMLDLYGGTGAVPIDGRSAELYIRGNRIRLLGADQRSGLSPRLLSSIPHDRFTVLLEHRPDDIESIAKTGKVDLYCAGHTHGGQVALPWYGAIITLSLFDKKYEHGLYRVRDTWLYVTRGIGMEGGPVPRVRFFARPEVTVIDVQGT